MFEGQGLDKMRRKAQIMMGNNFEFHMSVDGFSFYEIYDIMKKVLSDCWQHHPFEYNGSR